MRAIGLQLISSMLGQRHGLSPHRCNPKRCSNCCMSVSSVEVSAKSRESRQTASTTTSNVGYIIQSESSNGSSWPWGTLNGHDALKGTSMCQLSGKAYAKWDRHIIQCSPMARGSAFAACCVHTWVHHRTAVYFMYRITCVRRIGSTLPRLLLLLASHCVPS